MLDIEVHGVSQKRAGNLRRKIFKEFKGEPWLKETVVTICSSIVEDSKGENQPFFRLVDDTGDATTRKIIEKLVSFKLDIEYFKLTLFVPKIT